LYLFLPCFSSSYFLPRFLFSFGMCSQRYVLTAFIFGCRLCFIFFFYFPFLVPLPYGPLMFVRIRVSATH
jgi:hypothetical protein